MSQASGNRKEKQKTLEKCECGITFEKQRKWQKYCSTTCQYRAWSKVHRPPVKGKEVSA